jgi:hypothetical protein
VTETAFSRTELREFPREQDSTAGLYWEFEIDAWMEEKIDRCVPIVESRRLL